jgi:hypothetical protein
MLCVPRDAGALASGSAARDAHHRASPGHLPGAEAPFGRSVSYVAMTSAAAQMERPVKRSLNHLTSGGMSGAIEFGQARAWGRSF